MHPMHIKELVHGNEIEREIMDEQQFRPLHLAAAAGNADLVRALIEENCWINVRTKVS